MNGNLNKGAWKTMENTWSNALKNGQSVKCKDRANIFGLADSAGQVYC